MPDIGFPRRGQGRVEKPGTSQFDPSLEGGPETGEESRALLRVTGLELLDLVGGEEATGDGDHVAMGIDPFTVDTHRVTQAHGDQGQVPTGGQVEFHGTRHGGFAVGAAGEADHLGGLSQIVGQDQPQPGMGAQVGMTVTVQPEAAGSLLFMGGEQGP